MIHLCAGGESTRSELPVTVGTIDGSLRKKQHEHYRKANLNHIESTLKRWCDEEKMNLFLEILCYNSKMILYDAFVYVVCKVNQSMLVSLIDSIHIINIASIGYW